MRKSVAPFAIAVLAAVLSAGIVSAASPNAESTIIFEEPIEFTLPAGVCPDLPADLAIEFTGTIRGHLHVSVDAAGVFHVNAPDSIVGTATDSAGETYRFNYHNVLTAQDGGFPIVARITDHFNLVGNGAADQLHVGFTLRLIITEDGESVAFAVDRGDPALCDAI